MWDDGLRVEVGLPLVVLNELEWVAHFEVIRVHFRGHGFAEIGPALPLHLEHELPCSFEDREHSRRNISELKRASGHLVSEQKEVSLPPACLHLSQLTYVHGEA